MNRQHTTVLVYWTTTFHTRHCKLRPISYGHFLLQTRLTGLTKNNSRFLSKDVLEILKNIIHIYHMYNIHLKAKADEEKKYNLTLQPNGWQRNQDGGSFKMLIDMKKGCRKGWWGQPDEIRDLALTVWLRRQRRLRAHTSELRTSRHWRRRRRPRLSWGSMFRRSHQSHTVGRSWQRAPRGCAWCSSAPSLTSGSSPGHSSRRCAGRRCRHSRRRRTGGHWETRHRVDSAWCASARRLPTHRSGCCSSPPATDFAEKWIAVMVCNLSK